MENVELIRSARKTLAIQITREGRVVVRAPLRCSDQRIREFLAAQQGWIEKHLAKVQANPAPPPPTREELRALVERAVEILPPKVEYWSGVTGLTPAGITITSARTRYGSCSPKNRLSFSCFLVNYPEEAIDLVVVHELCHIREKNHGPRFYALLSRYLPDHKARKKLLGPLPGRGQAANGDEDGL
ncbi:MAG: M48 family metallopeptidase [Oscillibacter sp.]|nr:M48 family metallopeptidase [Oscillibacter sp.]